MTTYARITGTGSYLPERVLTNQELEQMVDTSDEWIQERTGIRARHIAADGQLTSDLGFRAAARAIDAAGISADQVDLIICATTTPDQTFPSTACLIQQRLGISGCGAFDVQAVCSGFVYALATADAFIRAGAARHVLVIGAETLSRIVDWKDRRTCILFADGAGAVVVSAADEPGIMTSHLHADGASKALLEVPWGPGQGLEALTEGGLSIQMQGNEVFKVAVTMLGRTVQETLKSAGLDKSELDWLVPHQANIRIIQATARKLKMSMDRVVVTVANHGNTSAASIPLAFDAAVRDGRIQPGQTCLLESFGGGFTWGSVLLKF